MRGGGTFGLVRRWRGSFGKTGLVFALLLARGRRIWGRLVELFLSQITAFYSDPSGSRATSHAARRRFRSILGRNISDRCLVSSRGATGGGTNYLRPCCFAVWV